MPATCVLRTLVVCLGSDITEQFEEVWQIIAEEFGANNQVLSSSVGLKSRAEELRLALYPKRGSSVGILAVEMGCQL